MDILGLVPYNEEWLTGPHWGEGDGDPRTEERNGVKYYEKSKVKDGTPEEERYKVITGTLKLKYHPSPVMQSSYSQLCLYLTHLGSEQTKTMLDSQSRPSE